VTDTLLKVEDLRVEFGSRAAPVAAVDGLGFEIARGETLVLVGESGSGKSLTALAVTRLLPAAARIAGGRVTLGELDLLGLPARRLCEVRGKRIGFVFQEPQVALNPVMRVGDQVAEVLRQHLGLRGSALRRRVIEALDAVGIPEPERRARDYPHQYSGGMKQRAMIAIALAGEPELLIADEPTTALDVTLQAQILALLKAEQQRRDMGMLFITHDFGVAWQVADRVAVLQAGRLVESAPREEFYRAPRHAYSRALFAALPRLERRPVVLPPATGPTPLLEVEDLRVRFPIRRGILRRTVDYVRAVDGVSFTLAAGETLAIVGESGSGKTTLGRGILRLLPLAGGSVRFRGEDLARLSGAELRRRRRHLQIVFQDSYAAMNPRMLVGDIIQEGMRAQGIGATWQARETRVAELLGQVGLDAAHARRYPHEFSGGQRQRICIARALAVEPALIVCDEPTSALDVSVQAQILDLLRDLQQRLGLAFLFITHNLGVVAQLAHRVAVMHQGVVVESGPVGEVLFAPRHPYTRQLLAAVPTIGATARPASLV
jgi:peptide/nickel transport system ATP-binding protein